jgi:hypothetical protein
MTRLQGLGRNPREVPATREFAHEQALASARQVDPSFDIAMPSEVDDEADDRSDVMRRMTFMSESLRFVRAGDDARGYWHLEWNRDYDWWLLQTFVADGSGWNVLRHYPIGAFLAGPGLEAFLRSKLVEGEVPLDIADELLRLLMGEVVRR